jgi:hypothetical protein
MTWIIYGPEPIYPSGRDRSKKVEGRWITSVKADIFIPRPGGGVEFGNGTTVREYKMVLLVNARCWTSIEPFGDQP